MTQNTAKITLAVNYLIASPHGGKLLSEIKYIVKNWENYPMSFDGSLSVLNEIVSVGTTNQKAFEALTKLVEQKRKLTPLSKRFLSTCARLPSSNSGNSSKQNLKRSPDQWRDQCSLLQLAGADKIVVFPRFSLLRYAGVCWSAGSNPATRTISSFLPMA
jgi:hypothetical protein